jgi:hypothetical protein
MPTAATIPPIANELCELSVFDVSGIEDQYAWSSGAFLDVILTLGPCFQSWPSFKRGPGRINDRYWVE